MEVLFVLAVAVVVAIVAMVRRDRSGALDDLGPMPGIGKSGKGERDPF